MGKILKLAAVQLAAAPAPLAERLQRAEALVVRAAQAGAQLIVLPELFNTGYSYRPEMLASAETAGGLTASWMKQASARLGVHLAGSILLRDGHDLYDALLLFAPDGRMWRYDKNYPWGWEHACFHARRFAPIADTDIGAIGMLICWDIAHPDLWRQYAGKVDLVVACSCPPDIPAGNYLFPDGSQVRGAQLGGALTALSQSSRSVYLATPAQQCAWLGVPFIGSTACGTVSTPIPNPAGSLIGFLPAAPGLIRYLKHCRQITIQAELVEAGIILSAEGQLLAGLRNEQGETFALAEVSLPAERPQPSLAQPKPPIPPLVYFVSDLFLPMVSKRTYAQQAKKLFLV